MKIERFQAILDAYGANPDQWPAEERNAAQHLAETSSTAQAMMTDAAALDQFLDAARGAIPQAEPSPELLADILAAATPAARHRWTALLWPFGLVWKPASALAMAGLLGLFLGAITPLPGATGSSVVYDDLDALLLGSTLEQEAQ
ncbi:MAG: hypothetical protein ACJAU6_003647 [Alphaproteobacteria bacterium]|jgi:hypothetical protein